MNIKLFFSYIKVFLLFYMTILVLFQSMTDLQLQIENMTKPIAKTAGN